MKFYTRQAVYGKVCSLLRRAEGKRTINPIICEALLRQAAHWMVEYQDSYRR